MGCWHGFLNLSLEWKLPSAGSKVSWLFDLSQIALEIQGFIFSSKRAFMLVILTFGFGCYWRYLFGLETSGLVDLVLKEPDLIWVRLAL